MIIKKKKYVNFLKNKNFKFMNKKKIKKINEIEKIIKK